VECRAVLVGVVRRLTDGSEGVHRLPDQLVRVARVRAFQPEPRGVDNPVVEVTVLVAKVPHGRQKQLRQGRAVLASERVGAQRLVRLVEHGVAAQELLHVSDVGPLVA
jgi:hypothetical protein